MKKIFIFIFALIMFFMSFARDIFAGTAGVYPDPLPDPGRTIIIAINHAQ